MDKRTQQTFVVASIAGVTGVLLYFLFKSNPQAPVAAARPIVRNTSLPGLSNPAIGQQTYRAGDIKMPASVSPWVPTPSQINTPDNGYAKPGVVQLPSSQQGVPSTTFAVFIPKAADAINGLPGLGGLFLFGSDPNVNDGILPFGAPRGTDGNSGASAATPWRSNGPYDQSAGVIAPDATTSNCGCSSGPGNGQTFFGSVNDLSQYLANNNQPHTLLATIDPVVNVRPVETITTLIGRGFSMFQPPTISDSASVPTPQADPFAYLKRPVSKGPGVAKVVGLDATAQSLTAHLA